MSSEINPKIIKMNSWVLPDESSWERKCDSISDSNKYDDFDEKYDKKTFYIKDQVTLVCPKLFNLEALLKKSSFYVDGTSLTPKLRRFQQYDQVELKVKKAKQLIVENECGIKSFQLNNRFLDVFAGLNCIVTVSKNNRLEWIRDFVEYYVNEHNLEALLFFDNQSTDYSLSDLNNLFATSKLKTYGIISTPFPYGPVLKDRRQHLQYLQTALLNIARQYYLLDARAVLSVDIDELVTPGERNIFDAAQLSLTKMMRFKGYWRYTNKSYSSYIAHKDHHYKPVPDVSCPHKYCYVPTSLAGRLALDMHGYSIKSSFLRKFAHFIILSSATKYWHCSGLTSRWKGNRLATIDNLVIDELMKTTMDRNFSEVSK